MNLSPKIDQNVHVDPCDTHPVWFNRHLERKKRLTVVLFFLATMLQSEQGKSHSFTQRAGFYEDNQSLDRRRLGVDLSFDGTIMSPLPQTQYSFGLSLVRDQDQLGFFEDDKVRELYGEGANRTNDQWSVTANQSWAQLTQTRFVVQGADDGVFANQTIGGGASRWILGESIRLSLDFSRTESQKPPLKILDFDSREVGEPARGVSQGTSLGIRHLATASTLVDYGLKRTATKGRPDTETYTLRLKQYLVNGSRQDQFESGNVSHTAAPEFADGQPGRDRRGFSLSQMKASVELAFARAINKGFVGLDTTYGEVDAVTWETYANAEFPGFLIARFGYRYYREEEVTRVLKEEKLFGSDLFSAGVSYLLDEPKGDQKASFRGNLVMGVYQTNQGLRGRSLELGFAALL